MNAARSAAAWLCLAHLLSTTGGLELRASARSCRAAFVASQAGCRLGKAALHAQLTQWLPRRAGMARQPQLGLSMSGKEEKNGVSGGRLVRALDGWLDRLEAKACKKYDKWSAKTNKIKSRAANLSSALSAVPGEITVPPAGGKQRKRDRLRRAWDLATSSRTSIACSIILLGFAVPGAVMAVGATLSVMTFVFLLVQILLITLAPAVPNPSPPAHHRPMKLQRTVAEPQEKCPKEREPP